MRRRLTPLLLLVFTTGCSPLGLDGGTERYLEVAPHKSVCTGLFPTLCLQVRDVGTDDYHNLYSTPIGFEFEWGFEYVILVVERDVDEVAADASSVRRSLRRIESKTPVADGSTFQLVMPPDGLESVGADRYRLFTGPEEVSCGTGPSCSELAEAVAAGDRVGLLLGYRPSPEAPFEIVSWTSCPDEGSCAP